MRARAVLIQIAVFNTLGIVAAAENRLEPETGIFTSYNWEWIYARNIRENLLRDTKPDHQVRMICCPSFAPEWSVTITRQGEGESFTEGTRDYFVEYAGADERIWNDENKAVTVRVRRVQVGLDRATAEAVSEVWHRMLLEVRHPGIQKRSEDGVTYHFSRAAGPIKGGPPWGHGHCSLQGIFDGSSCSC